MKLGLPIIFHSPYDLTVALHKLYYTHAETFWEGNYQIDYSMQDCGNSIANTLELIEPCTNPSNIDIIHMAWQV